MAEAFQFFMDRANLDFFKNLEGRVAEVIRQRSATIAVAESVTGGLISMMLTSSPGSSAYFLGGAVCYSPRAKIIQTGIDPKIIAEKGLVSEQTAIGLAKGIRQRLVASLGIGVTGAAGPDPHGGKPVGTVYIALSEKERDIVKEFVFDGSREDIQKKAAHAALNMLLLYLKGSEE
jgi:PncC family amidohydrolase